MVGPVRVNVFLNGLGAGARFTTNKFDDTKLGGAVSSLEEQEDLQRYLEGLEH